MRDFEDYATVITDPARKRSLLLYTAGEKIQDIFDILIGPVPDEEQSEYDIAVSALFRYFAPTATMTMTKEMKGQLDAAPQAMPANDNEPVDELDSPAYQDGRVHHKDDRADDDAPDDGDSPEHAECDAPEHVPDDRDAGPDHADEGDTTSADDDPGPDSDHDKHADEGDTTSAHEAPDPDSEHDKHDDEDSGCDEQPYPDETRTSPTTIRDLSDNYGHDDDGHDMCDDHGYDTIDDALSANESDNDNLIDRERHERGRTPKRSERRERPMTGQSATSRRERHSQRSMTVANFEFFEYHLDPAKQTRMNRVSDHINRMD